MMSQWHICLVKYNHNHLVKLLLLGREASECGELSVQLNIPLCSAWSERECAEGGGSQN